MFWLLNVLTNPKSLQFESSTRDSTQNFNLLAQIDIPLRPSQKSRSLVWKNWSRMHLFDFTKRFKDNPCDARNTPSPDTINKRQKAALTLSDFSKRFNYRSMRNKARKMCTRNPTALVTNAEPNSDKIEPHADIRAASSWRSFVIWLCNKLFDCI